LRVQNGVSIRTIINAPVTIADNVVTTIAWWYMRWSKAYFPAFGGEGAFADRT
jgi:hypothetical protein